MLDQAVREPHEAQRVTLRVVSSVAEFDELATQWRALHDACRDTSVFQSFEWQRTWWQHCGEPQRRMQLHVLVVQQEGQTVAIAPFFIETLQLLGIRTVRQLGLIGRGISDYTDTLMLPGFESTACVAIAQHLALTDVCDVMSFIDVPDASPVRKLLADDLTRAEWHGQSAVREQCPRTRLLTSWPETLASFGETHRKRVAYLDRKLRKNFQVEVRRVGANEAPAAALDELMTMHQRRWVAAGESGAFASPHVRAFHHDVVRKLHARGWLDLSFLMLDGCAAVANYSFKSGGRLQFYLSGSGEKEDVRRFAPGILLHAYCMEEMIAEGMHTYDFLRGTERYKYDLGAQDVPSWGLRFVKDAAGVRARYRLGARAKHWLATLQKGRVAHR